MSVKALNPEKDYLILVPVNQEGEDELYRGEIHNDEYIGHNFRYMLFHEEQYVYMESALFDIINVELGTLINMYEEEIVESERTGQLLDIIDMLIRNSDDDRFLKFAEEFRSLVQLAIEHHTSVGFYF